MQILMLIALGGAMVAGCSNGGPTRAEREPRDAPAITCREVIYTGRTADISVEIPDADPSGITLGPMRLVDDGCPIDRLMVGVDIVHSYSGDLEMRLLYDQDRDGSPDMEADLDLFRARVSACPDVEVGACPVELRGTIFFSSESPDGSPDEVPPLRTLVGLAKGGDLYLVVIDGEVGDAGVVRSWAVYVGESAHLTLNGSSR